MKNYIVYIFLTLQMTAWGQENIINQIDLFNLSVLNRLKKDYNYNVEGYDLDNYNIRIIPSFYCSIDKNFKEHYLLDSSLFKIIGISKKSTDTLMLDSSKNRIIKSNWDDSKFEFDILKKSKYCFYIYCLKKESGLNTLMGYFDHGKISIVDFRFNNYKNLYDAIKFYWGSLEKVHDVENIDKSNEDFLANTSLEQAKGIIKNSYSECYRLYPKDTLFVLETYLNEIETKVPLFEGQREFLKRLIQKNIENRDHENAKNPEYDYFMTNFISFELFTTLTFSQYFDYKKNNIIINQKIKQAKGILLNYLINQKMNSPEKYDEYLKKEIFKKQ